jgi:hypothetical protein
MNTLSKYIQMMLESKFPQSYLLSSDDFVRFLKDVGLDLEKEDLEFYDKTGIIKPVLKLKKQKVNETFPKYPMIMSDIFSLQEYYRNGLAEIVEDEYFPWQSYKDEHEQSVILYYHPFQFLPMRTLRMGLEPRLKPSYFENKLKDIKKDFDFYKERITNLVNIRRKRYEEFWTPRLGLLILLDQAYGPWVKPFKANVLSDPKSYLNKWNLWRMNEFTPDEILNISNLSIKEIKDWYETVAVEGDWMDPLSNWYVLQRIVKDSMKMRLKGPALYAQHCYRLAKILSYFIFDLTGEKMYEPDDIMDGNGHGMWKSRVYGDPFDYTTKQTRIRILDTFLIERPFRAGIIFEGDTEQVVIESILNALRVDKERDGFFLYNAKGQKNIIHNLKSLYHISKLQEIELFLILDNDEDATRVQDQLKNYIKRENITIWSKDFEFDNFGVEKILVELNIILKSKDIQPLSNAQVSETLENSNRTPMNVVSSTLNQRSGVKLDEIISKKELAQKLISSRSIDIASERFEGEGWKPKLPIEVVLNKIFRKMPNRTFA